MLELPSLRVPREAALGIPICAVLEEATMAVVRLRARTENDESTMAVARYILENPLRARLVERVEDYPFAGSCQYPLHEILEAVADSNR